MVKKKKESLLKKIFLGILKIPYHIYLLIKKIFIVLRKSSEENKIKNSREKLVASYREIKVIEAKKGNYSGWEKKVFNAESAIGIILGARGSGKTSFGVKFLENIYSKTKKKCYAIGFKKESMPSWINVIEDIKEITNNSMVLIDEGGILFSSRKSMSSPNKLLSDLILISRHKNLSIIFISQNSSNLDVNILRQADFLVLKKTSLLQKDFERKKIQEIYLEIQKDFEKYSSKEIAFIYSDSFQGFVSCPLPSFWSIKISKSFETK